MSLVYLGSLSVGAAVPGASTAVTAGMAGINAALANLLAQLTALQAFVPTPVDFAAQLALAQQMVASVNLAIAAGLPVPSIAVQIAMIGVQIAELTAQIAGITAELDILVALEAPLLVAGVHGYAYDGAVNALGSALTSALSGGVPGGGGGGEHSNAVVYITTAPAAWDAMSVVFKVTP